MRIRYLDSLRGIAALCVVVFHFLGGFGPLPGVPELLLKSPLAFLTDGIAAVGLFFVLSGLVLTFKAFRNPESYSLSDSIDTFLIHRVMRIMPPFIAWVILSALCQRYLYPYAQHIPNQSTWLQLTWAEPAGLKRVLRELFILAPAPGVHLISQDWSLTYEMNMSLFIPLYTLLALAGNVPFYFYMLLRSTNNVFLFQFFLGMVISKHFEFIQAKTSKFSRVGLFSVLFAGLSFYCFRDIAGEFVNAHFHGHAEPIFWTMNGIGSAIVICVAIGSLSFQKILLHPALLWLGKVSYSLYLLHMVVLKCLTPILLIELAKMGLGKNLVVWLGLALTVSISLVLADISYRLFEDPFILLGKKISKNWKLLLASRFPHYVVQPQ